MRRLVKKIVSLSLETSYINLIENITCREELLAFVNFWIVIVKGYK